MINQYTSHLRIKELSDSNKEKKELIEKLYDYIDTGKGCEIVSDHSAMVAIENLLPRIKER